MTRKRLRAEIDSEELTDWQAFDRVDPFGQERADFRAGMIASNYSNWKRSPNSDRFKPGDFMWKYGPGDAVPEQTDAEVEQAIDAAMRPLMAAA